MEKSKDYQFQPNTYYRDEFGRIIKIKDNENGMIVGDFNGTEKRVDSGTLSKYLKSNGYKMINQEEISTKEGIQSLVESNVEAIKIVNILS